MNALIATGIALAISLAGNLWLFNSRDKALVANGELQTSLNTATETGKLCSASVAKLSEDAKTAADKAKLDIAAARDSSKGKQATGQATLGKTPSVANDACKSTVNLVDEWYSERFPK